MNKNRIKINWRLVGASLVVAALLLAAFGLARAGVLVPPQRLDVQPDPGIHTASVDASISIAYDQDMDPTTVNPQTFAVHARQTGRLMELLGVTGGTITLDPLNDLHAGELVQTSATTATLSLGGDAPLMPSVWQFTTATWGGNAVFHEHQILTSGDSRDAALGDLDGDGDLDVITTSCFDNVHSVYHNDGSGTFTLVQNFYFNTCFLDAELGDLDGDGDLDVILIDHHLIGTKVLWNDGDGTFTDSGQSLGDDDCYGELGDLDGDGDLDYFVTAGGFGENTLQIWQNDGAGVFTLIDDFDSAYEHMDVRLGDLDGDYDLDAFTAGWNDTYNKVWLNDGTGAFSEAQSIPNANTTGIQLGDLDGDGDLDVYLANTAFDVTDLPDEIWLNDGTGRFTNSGQSLDTVLSAFPALGDLDADGDLDVYLSGDPMGPDSDEVWANDGEGIYSLFRTVDENYPGGIVNLGDLDGDGNLDAFTASQYLPNSFQIYLNGDWTQAEPIPEPLMGSSVQCPEQPDSFYLVGGLTVGGIDSNHLYRYDADSNDWTLLASMPGTRRAASVACYQGRIYVAGGAFGGVWGSLFIYDITSNTWSQGANLPNPVWGAFMGAWDGKLYLAGGSRGGDTYPPVDRVDVYDIATNTWTAGGGTSMLVATDFAGSVQAGQYLYIAGGVVGDGIHLHDETQRYNMAADTWELGPPLTIPQWSAGLAVTESRLYLLGGSDSIITWNPLDKVDMLELADWPGGAWTDLGDPLPKLNLYPATGCTEAMLGGEIWAVGGGPNLETIYDANLYYPAEPCVSFGVSLAPEGQEDDGYPGNTVDYALTLTNTGNITDYFRLTASSLWVITLPEMVGPLGAGESAVITVSITIPADAGAGDADTASITAASISNSALADSSTLTTSANPVYNLELAVDASELTGMPGETVTFTLQISNQGNITDTYDLDCLGDEWPMEMPITQVTLAPGASADVILTVHIPLQAMPGQWDAMTFTAVSQGDPNEAHEAELTATVTGNLFYLPVIVR